MAPPDLGSGRAHARLDALVLLLCVMTAAFAACTSAPEGAAPAKIGAGWSLARTSPGHSAHIERGIRCEDCHGVEGGQFDLPPSEACDSCHAEQRLHHGDGRATDDCTR